MAKEFICSATSPVVQTNAGKLRGFVVDGTYTFHGIKYADAKRFQMPQPVAPWEGIRDALSYGYVSPILNRETASGEVKIPHRYWPKDENCQYLNVWTQSLDPQAKRPVMVWLHGGGFWDGSSIEHVAYDGENLSRFGDVVVVTVNHRLNILGYLDLSPYGEKYWNSGNAGNADLVASLQWVHDNIAQFGGDPENVTISASPAAAGRSPLSCRPRRQRPVPKGHHYERRVPTAPCRRKNPTAAPWSRPCCKSWAWRKRT